MDIDTSDATWVQTFSGGAVDLLTPKPEQILLVDIAHALSRIARFNGHTRGERPWSVAQHSLLVESLMPVAVEADPVTRLLALLHDAHEAYVGDIATPVKMALRSLTPPSYAGGTTRVVDPLAVVQAGLDIAIRDAFALPEPSEAQCQAIATADLLALRIERDALMAPPPRDWCPLPDPLDPLPDLTPLLPDVAKIAFIMRVRDLIDMRHGVGVYPMEREKEWLTKNG